MSKAEQIRQLYQEGKPVSEVAKTLGIRYQHAYNVLRKAGLLRSKGEEVDPEGYAEFIAGLELLGVELWELSAKLEHRPEGKKGVNLGIEPFGPEPLDGGFQAGLVLTVGLLEDGKSFGQIRVKVLARYRSSVLPKDAFFKAFAERNLPLNLWPYLRFYVDFATAQMGLSRLMLPLFKI
jgi:hypothetical protein